jgi:hypothetical protein
MSTCAGTPEGEAEGARARGAVGLSTVLLLRHGEALRSHLHLRSRARQVDALWMYPPLPFPLAQSHVEETIERIKAKAGIEG